MKDSFQGLYNREWLSSILQRIKLTPLGAAILMAAINLIVDLPLALHFGALLPSEKSQGLAGEPADWIYEFLVHPVILGYFCWLQKEGEQLFAELARGEIIESEEHLQKVLVKCRKRLQNRWGPLICTASSLVFASWFTLAFAPSSVLSPYSSAPYPSWVTVHPTIAWVRAPVIFVVFYALAMTIYDLAVIIITLNDSLRNQRIQVEPFNPDKAGGLGFIGRFSANLGYLIGVLGLLLSVRTIQAPADLSDTRNYVFILGFAVYLLLAPTIFFLPLWATHTAMVSFRDHLLTELATKLDSVLEQLRAPHRKNAEQIEPLLEDFQQLDKVHALIIDQVPVWPFNTKSLRKFFGLTLSPLTPAVVSVIIDRVKELVTGLIS